MMTLSELQATDMWEDYSPEFISETETTYTYLINGDLYTVLLDREEASV